jgi:hypothetical protein
VRRSGGTDFCSWEHAHNPSGLGEGSRQEGSVKRWYSFIGSIGYAPSASTTDGRIGCWTARDRSTGKRDGWARKNMWGALPFLQGGSMSARPTAVKGWMEIEEEVSTFDSDGRSDAGNGRAAPNALLHPRSHSTPADTKPLNLMLRSCSTSSSTLVSCSSKRDAL